MVPSPRYFSIILENHASETTRRSFTGNFPRSTQFNHTKSRSLEVTRMGFYPMDCARPEHSCGPHGCKSSLSVNRNAPAASESFECHSHLPKDGSQSCAAAYGSKHALTSAHRDRASFEIQILDPQSGAFVQPKTAAVNYLYH